MDDWIISKEATCTEEGTKVHICSKCKTSESAIIEKADHTVIVDSAVEATCISTGLTAGSHCSVCGAKILIQQETPTIEHIVVTDSAVEATCSHVGLTEGSHCKICHKVFVVQEIIAKKNHSPETDEAAAPTCLHTGLTQGSHCTVCHEILEEQHTVSKVDCDFEYGRCKYCNAIDLVSKTNEIEAENNRHSDRLVEIEDYYTDYINRLQNRIDAYGFSYTYTDDYCYTQISDLTTQISAIERKIASLSGSTNSSDVAERRRYESQKAQLESDRDTYYSMITVNGLKDAQNDARFDKTNAIRSENELNSSNLNIIEKKYTCPNSTDGKHVVANMPRVEPTCINNGLSQGAYCSECGCILCVQETILALGHDYSIYIETVAPTCTERGYTTFKCSRCDNQENREYTSELGHEFTYISTVSPTCTEEGYAIYQCSFCHSHSHMNIVLALGHTPGTEATCETDQVCTVCHSVLIEKHHTYSDAWAIDSPATFEQNGEKSKYCIYCNHRDSITVIPKQEFSFSLSSDGLSYLCTGIGTVTDSNVVIPSMYNELPVSRIQNNAFYNNSFLETVKVQNGVADIGAYAFYGCAKLKSIECYGVKNVETFAFSSCLLLENAKVMALVSDSTVYYPIIYQKAFYNCVALKSVEVGNYVTSPESPKSFYGSGRIYGYCFSGCTSLTNINIRSADSLGEGIFENCTSLVSITLPDSLLLIEVKAFKGCTSLQSVIMPNDKWYIYTNQYVTYKEYDVSSPAANAYNFVNAYTYNKIVR